MSSTEPVRRLRDEPGSPSADAAAAAGDRRDGLARDWLAGGTGRPSRLADVKGEPSERRRRRDRRRDRADDAANEFVVSVWTAGTLVVRVAAVAVTIYLLRIALGADVEAPWLKTLIPLLGGVVVSAIVTPSLRRIVDSHLVRPVGSVVNRRLRQHNGA